jgi:hypothetical protein
MFYFMGLQSPALFLHEKLSLWDILHDVLGRVIQGLFVQGRNVMTPN